MKRQFLLFSALAVATIAIPARAETDCSLVEVRGVLVDMERKQVEALEIGTRYEPAEEVGKKNKRPFHQTSEYRLQPGTDNTPLG